MTCIEKTKSKCLICFQPCEYCEAHSKCVYELIDKYNDVMVTLKSLIAKYEIQRQSEGIKKGEPPDHQQAVQRVIKFWNKHCTSICRPITDMKIYFTPDFIKRQMLDKSNREYYGHMPDIALITEIFNYSREIYEHRLRLIIEVDGPRHDSKNVQLYDNVFKDYIDEEYSGHVQIIRLRRDELLGQTSDVEIYLKDKLKGFLK